MNNKEWQCCLGLVRLARQVMGICLIFPNRYYLNCKIQGFLVYCLT